MNINAQMVSLHLLAVIISVSYQTPNIRYTSEVEFLYIHSMNTHLVGKNYAFQCVLDLRRLTVHDKT